MTLLVTGAAGQVGQAICQLTADRGLPCRGLTRGELDVTDARAVERAIAGATLVINAAAYTAVDRAESEPDAAYAINRDGAANVAAGCAEAGIPLLHISTDYVFDGRKPTPYREDDPISPLGVYGASKAAGEAAVRDRMRGHIILRTAWVFSPHGQNFVRSILRAASELDVLGVVDDQHGGPTAAADVAAALLTIGQAVQRDGFSRWGTYHFCGAPTVTRYQFAATILGDRPGVTLRPVKSSAYKTAAARPANSALDCTRVADSFGIAQPSWERALIDLRFGFSPTP